MRRALCCAVLTLGSACPRTAPAPAVASQPAGVGCPAASDVFVASYVQPAEGEQGHAGWVLPLHDARVESVEGAPAFATIDAAAAAAAGVPAPPRTVWLLPPNAPMCQATVGDFYAAAIDAPTPNIAYGALLAGCPAPTETDAGMAIALVSAQPPSECKAIAPRPVAARLGDIDAQGQWSRPTQETPMPAAFAQVVPARTCAAPDCEMLWSVAEVTVDGRPVAWSGAVNWLEIPPGAAPSTQCEWKLDTFSGFFVAGADGAPVRVTEAQNHPLVLTAVLADRQGPKVLLATGVGEYTSYDLASGTATAGRHLVWLLEHPEAYGAIDRLGPDCGI